MRNNKESKMRAQLDRFARPTAGTLRREIARHERMESYGKLALGVLGSLVVVAAAIVLVTNLWLAVLTVDGTSMSPLLEMNEIVLVVRKGEPARNDVIAFTHSDKIYIKRVIGAGGDQVEIREDGIVAVNGRTLNEPYAAELCRGNCDIEFPYQAPAETFFVMGDNRSASMDSRDSRFGPVSREQIVGRVTFRLWPLSRIGRVS